MRPSALLLTLLVSVAAFAQLPPPPGGGDQAKQPRIHVAQRSHDLGTIVDGDKAQLSWKIENHGTADLVIEQTRSTCGCTVVSLQDSDKVIPPGGSLDLKAEFNSKGRPGDQRKAVAVFSNDPAEPEVKLEFHAKVESLFDIDPPGMLNLRASQRGKPAEKSIDIRPATGRKSVQVSEVRIEGDAAIEHSIEPLPLPGGMGQRIKLVVPDIAPLGTLTANAAIRFSVDGIEREWIVPIRADVVGDLSWTPQVLDATRQVLVPGRNLAPVTVRSTDKAPFDVIDVAAGPLLDASYEQVSSSPAASAFSVYLGVREGVPAGPFATTLEIRTTSLDQPLIQVPVFGIITPPLQADPPIIVLRADGTPVGTERRVKLLADPAKELTVLGVSCDHPEIVAGIDDPQARHPRHVEFLRIKLTGDHSAGPQRTALRVATNIPGYEQFEIPLVIEPKK